MGSFGKQVIGFWVENKFKLFFVNFLRYAIPYCPYWLLDVVANLSGVFTHKIGGNKIRIMSVELEKLIGTHLPQDQIDRIVRRGVYNSRKDLFDTWVFPRLTQEKVRKMAYLAGKENLDAALARGMGAIILVVHFGLRKLLLPVLAYEGYKVNQIASKPTSWKKEGKRWTIHKKVMDIEFACEKSLNVNFIYTDESLRPIFRALKHNEIVVLALDGPTGDRRVKVKFLGSTANFSPSAMLLASKVSAPVLPAFVVRQKDNRHKVIIEKPLAFRSDQDKETAIQESLNSFRDIFERYFLSYPCHYVDWLYRVRLWPIREGVFVFD